ncbi:hypothetical protein JNK13_10870 [bacterium]|nr:hypothetical protein [bacterium]
MKSSKAGIFFLILFSLPFAAVGVFAGYTAVQNYLAGKDLIKEVLLLGTFSFVFSAFGFGLMLAVIYGGKLADTEADLKELYPTEPWKWKKEWNELKIRNQGKAAALGLFIFAILWNAIGSIPIIAFLPEELAKGNNSAWIGLIFPLAGVILLFHAGRLILQAREVGDVYYIPQRLPGVIGGFLEGSIDLTNSREPQASGTLILTCYHIDSTGDNTSTTVIWQGEQVVDVNLLKQRRIPVRFQIPSDLPSSSPDYKSVRYEWKLCLAFAKRGIDLKVEFILPVFKTKDSVENISREEIVKNVTPTSLDPSEFAKHGISISRIGDSEIIYFGPLRNIGTVIAFSTFTLIWVAVAVGTYIGKAPLIFPIVFGFSGLLMIYGLLWCWVGSYRIRISARDLGLKIAWLGIGREKVFTKPEIKGIAVDNGMTSGNTQFYDLHVILNRESKTMQFMQRKYSRLAGEKMPDLGINAFQFVKVASSIPGKKPAQDIALYIVKILRIEFYDNPRRKMLIDKSA